MGVKYWINDKFYTNSWINASRSHDLPAIISSKCFHWRRNNVNHRNYGLPVHIYEKGDKEWEKDGEDYFRENYYPDFIAYNGKRK